MQTLNGKFTPSLRSVARDARVVHRHDDHDFDLVAENAFTQTEDEAKDESRVAPLRAPRPRYSPEEIARELDLEELKKLQKNGGLNRFNLRFIQG